MTPRARELIEHLGLQPHPEGGFYAEVHRSRLIVHVDGRPPRAALTSIYFLLVDGGASRWHRVASDEVWLHLEGAPVHLHLLDEASRALRSVQLGPMLASDSQPQSTVPAGVWQAARVVGEHALLGCIVAPGFEFDDFAMLGADTPLAAWLALTQPALATLI